jgi:hypothetical protein
MLCPAEPMNQMDTASRSSKILTLWYLTSAQAGAPHLPKRAGDSAGMANA